MSTRIKPDLARVSALVVDTSVLAAYFLDEPGVLNLERVKAKLQVPFIALCELHYLVTRKQGRPLADQCFGLIKAWGIPILHSTDEGILAASHLKHTFRMGLADAFVAAASLCEQLPLLTYDSDFLPLSKEIQLLGIK